MSRLPDFVTVRKRKCVRDSALGQSVISPSPPPKVSRREDLSSPPGSVDDGEVVAMDPGIPGAAMNVPAPALVDIHGLAQLLADLLAQRPAPPPVAPPPPADPATARALDRLSRPVLSSFFTHNPETWFSMVESQFALCNVADEAQKFGLVAAKLDEETATAVSHLLQHPPQLAHGAISGIEESFVDEVWPHTGS